MKAEYKRDLQSNYLILEAGEGKGEEDYRVHMVEQNRIPGLLPLCRTRTDGIWHLHYEITGLQTVSSLYEKKLLSEADILFLLAGVSEMLDTLQRYLLSPEQVVLSPDYIFTEPERRRLQFCYAPGLKNDAPISLLAEFLLKRLNHQDSGAVALGYLFYQRTQEENFSLQKSLKQILEEQRIALAGYRDGPEGAGTSGQPEGQGRPAAAAAGAGRREAEGNGNGSDGRKEERRYDRDRIDQREDWEQPEEVIHRRRKKKNRIVNRIFQAVHPAVLLSGLFLLAALEGIYYLGYLRLSEAGGAFFLILAACLLANSQWKKHREEKEAQKYGRWAEEEQEESEEYLQVKEELYSPAPEMPYAEETRCLNDCAAPGGIRLILIRLPENPVPSLELYQEIHLEKGMLVIGKIREQCDVLLNAATVSRVHARLERRGDRYFVKDLNSRNGSFLNGQRLKPQEEKEFRPGDQIAFAEIGYRAVQ